MEFSFNSWPLLTYQTTPSPSLAYIAQDDPGTPFKLMAEQQSFFLNLVRELLFESMIPLYCIYTQLSGWKFITIN